MKKMFLLNIILVCLLLFSALIFADSPENPRAYKSLKVKLTQSGSMHAIEIAKMNISILIPQENVADISVHAPGAEWEYIHDDFGNRLVFIEWENPEEYIGYRIETIVDNVVKPVHDQGLISYDPTFVEETDYIVIDGQIQKIAYAYENSLEGVFELTEWVHDYITYDLNYVGKNLTSTEILEKKRGVCMEYAKLLAALLRSKKIPTRFVIGYAYSGVEEKFIAHAWNEVLTTGGWVPFDPTWLQGGFVDATHIKTGSMLDADAATKVSYSSVSSNALVDWSQNNDQFEILEYSTESPVKLVVDAKRSLFSNSSGYVKVSLDSDKCLISQIKARSCVDEQGDALFDFIYDKKTTWSCEKQDIYFFFRQDKGRERYICPVNVFDQIGSTAGVNISIFDQSEIKRIYISGPDNVNINEDFQLISSEKQDFIFYSPEFGTGDSAWDLNIKKPGSYDFYLYSDGALAAKTISVVEEKEFELTISMPKNVSLYGTFILEVGARNLQNKEKTADLSVYFGNKKQNRVISFSPGEEKHISFNITADKSRRQDVVVSVQSDSLTTYSSSILVYEIKSQTRTWLDDISDFFASIFNWFAGLF